MKNESFSGGLETKSDTALLQLMAGTDEVQRQKAYNCFHARHSEKLAGLCGKACKKQAIIYGRELPAVVFHNTLLEVYQHPLEVLRRLEEEPDASGKKLTVEVLLSTMANEELEKETNGEHNKYVSLNTRVKNDAELNWFALQKNPVGEAEVVDERKRLADAKALGADLQQLDAACNKLKPRDKALIGFIKKYEPLGQHLPPEEKARFLKEWGLSELNFRKCKERSFKKLRDSVLEARRKRAAQDGSDSDEAAVG